MTGWLARKALPLNGTNRVLTLLKPSARLEILQAGTSYKPTTLPFFLHIFAQKIYERPDSCANCAVAIVNRAERHFDRQSFISQQLDKFPAGNLLIYHIIRQTGDAIAAQAQLLYRFTTIG